MNNARDSGRGAARNRVITALERHGSRVTGHGDQRMAQCSARDHDDNKESLSIGPREKDPPGVVMFCQAGCDLEAEILPPLNLTIDDLFDQPRERAERPRDVQYPYHNETGTLLSRKTRYGDKRFVWHHPDGNGAWLRGRGDTRHVIYRLHEVAAAIRDGRTVYCVEGEDDANRLASMGLVATSGPDGAAKGNQSPKWTAAYSDMLAGAAEVVIIADNDEPGIAHARATLAGINGKVKSARIMTGLATGKGADVSDHLNAGYKLADLIPLPDEQKTADAENCSPEPEAPRERRLVLTPASQIEPEPVIWAWEDDGHGRIPAGSMGLFAGREGTGKSSFLIWLAAQITRGYLPGAWHGTPRAVVYVAVEDSWKFTIVPRLIAAGADLDLVYRAEVHVIEGETVSLCLPADLKMLEQAITENLVAMVALDPMMSAISEALDTHVNRDVRRALDPLARMADRTGAVIAGIAHFNKSAGQDASSLVTGSGAFKDVARFIFAFARDDDDTQVITQTKNSLGMSNLPSLDYRIIEAVVETPKGDARVGRFVPGGVSEKTVHDILASQAHGLADRDAKTSAEDFLKKALGGGPRLSKDVEEEAREGERISKRTLDRARRDLGIRSAKRGDGWWIALPEHEGDLAALPPAGMPKDAKVANLGTVGNVAKVAKASPPGTLGNLGNIDEADRRSRELASDDFKDAKVANSAPPHPVGTVGNLDDADIGYLGGTNGRALRDLRPPCDKDDLNHALCWDPEAMDGRCLIAAWPAGSGGEDANR